MTMLAFWTIVTMLALLLGAGIAAMFCYGLSLSLLALPFSVELSLLGFCAHD